MKGPTYLIVITLIFLSINTYSQSHKKVKFTPTHYYSFFSGATSPVLSIYPGDTIITSSVDCDGFDRNLKLCTSGKSVNPLTGPFYISGAEEGDIVKITFTDIRFSRNTAFSLPYFHPRSMNDSIAQLANNDSLPIIWDLNFTVKGYLFPPVKDGSVIRSANTNILDMNSANLRYANVLTQPDPLNAEPDDEFGFSESIIEYK